MAGVADPTFPNGVAQDFGLLITNFTLGNTASPLTNLLGIGDGTCAAYGTGNKLDDLFTFMYSATDVKKRFNYGIFKDLSALRQPLADTFTTAGKGYILGALTKFYTSNPACKRGASISLWFPTVYTPDGGTSGWNGIGSVKSVIDYNANTANANYKFTHLFFLDAWWDFPYDQAVLGTGTVDINTVGYSNGFINANAGTNFVTGPIQVLVNDFIKVGNCWRQVVNVQPTQLTVDRGFFGSPVSGSEPTITNAAGINLPWSHLRTTKLDYDTFLYRLYEARRQVFRSGQESQLKFDLFVGRPSYTFKSTVTGRNFQVTQLVNIAYPVSLAPSQVRVIFKTYQRLPSYTYDTASTLTVEPIDAQYQDLPTGVTYSRLLNDLSSGDIAKVEMGFGVSVETARLNYTGGNDIVRNYSGYVISGKSLDGSTTRSNAFAPLDISGNPTPNTAQIVSDPPGPYPIALAAYIAKNPEKIWQYVVGTDTAGTTPIAVANNAILGCSPTFNTLSNTVGSPIKNYVEKFNAMIYDNQEFLRSGLVPLTGVITAVQPTCNGGTGSATVVASGGTAPYTYLWSTTETTATITGLAAAVYTVVVTDALGAHTTPTSPLTVTITAPAAIVTSATQTNVLSCAGFAGGSITVTTPLPSGIPTLWHAVYPDDGCITPPGLSTTWSTDTVYTALPAGDYQVCSAGSPFGACAVCICKTITETIMSVNSSQTAITCHGGTNGIITGSVSNGTGPFTYELLDFVTGAVIQTYVGTTGGSTDSHNFTLLGPNSYLIRITDSYGCVKTTSSAETLINPADITFTLSQTGVTCAGNCDGSVTVSAGSTSAAGTVSLYSCVGGTLQLLDTLTGALDGTFTFPTLCEGKYCVQLNTNTGCYSPEVHITVTNAGDFTPQYTVVSNSGCATADGSITLNSDPTDLTFLWNDAVTTASRTDLIAGTYSVIVTLAGCSKTFHFTITAECPEFTTGEFKVTLFNAKCCFAALMDKVYNHLNMGYPIETSCDIFKAKLLYMIIQRLERITNISCNPEVLGCAEVKTLMDKIHDLCKCECDANGIPVTYDSYTDQLNAIQ